MDAIDHRDVLKLQGETYKLVADFGDRATRRIRQPDTAYTTGTRVQPAKATGFQYNASTGGVSGTIEPRWPITAAQTVKDGSITWTAEAVSSASLERTLQSAAWSNGGLTLGTPVTSGQESYALVSGGTPGQSYVVQCTGTMSDGTIKAVAWVVTVGSVA